MLSLTLLKLCCVLAMEQPKRHFELTDGPSIAWKTEEARLSNMLLTLANFVFSLLPIATTKSPPGATSTRFDMCIVAVVIVPWRVLSRLQGWYNRGAVLCRSIWVEGL